MPIKSKMLRAFDVPYEIKTLKKGIMKQTELKTKHLKNKTDIHLNLCKNKGIFNKLYKKEWKNYCNNSNMLYIW